MNVPGGAAILSRHRLRRLANQSFKRGGRTPEGDFDAVALFAALDDERVSRGLSWRQVADQIWEQSSELNRRRHDHPISPATLTSIPKRGDTSCQHALFILRWLGRTPESFCSPHPARSEEAALPAAGPDRRLRWNLGAMYDALDARRRERQLTWVELARELHCTQHQLTGIRTARFAIGMRLAMRIVVWLDCPAATFVYAGAW